LFEVNESIRWPDYLAQLVPSNDLTRMLQQHLQNLEWLILELDLDTTFTEFSSTKIGLE